MQYDPFQIQAMELVRQNRSVLVCAPTGAGKTVIAEYAIEQAMAAGQRAIYTAPIKALSNQKYRDFTALYGQAIGIITGDVSLNPSAPILIMTTEIYRNTLFENPRRVADVRWVIFDEVHYLDDPERGTVWEEAIMFSPPSVQLLCLSATIPNVDQIATWMRTVLDRPIEVVAESERPVPLQSWFQCQGLFFDQTDRLRREGYANRDVWKIPRYARHRRFRVRSEASDSSAEWRARPNRLEPLIRHLQSKDRLPCIYFAFGRRRTEELAQESTSFQLLDAEEQAKAAQQFKTLCERYSLVDEKSAWPLRDLVSRGIAYHHAGMLPTLKEVVEQLFTSRLVKLIFTTETFALGINMPARSVVFDQLRKFYGRGFANLRTRDFYQMAGRAGRRGMDACGFVYVRVNPHDISFSELTRVVYGKNESVISQFNTAYATLLNLYRQFGRELIQIYPRSLHHFQSNHPHQQDAVGLIERKIDLLHDMGYLQRKGLTEKGDFACWVYGYELLLGEMYGDGFLEQLNAAELAVVLAGLVFEPRRSEHPPRYEKVVRRLQHQALGYLANIHKRERKFQIFPRTKSPHLHLSPALIAWLRGESFDRTMRMTDIDEGEVVRYFRMVIQLLRQMRLAPGVPEALKRTAQDTLVALNRGVVDAEKQLRS